MTTRAVSYYSIEYSSVQNTTKTLIKAKDHKSTSFMYICPTNKASTHCILKTLPFKQPNKERVWSCNTY